MESNDLELFASCLCGLEKMLACELKALGGHRVRPLRGGVSFFSDVAGALRICLWSRLASHITLVVGRIGASDAEEVYEGIRKMSWDSVIAPDASIAVRVYGTTENLRNTHFTALKIKDALCDCLEEVRGVRPSVNVAAPDALLDVRLHQKRLTISLNLSGQSLYQRPYLAKEDTADASLLCARAAGLLAFVGWEFAIGTQGGMQDDMQSNMQGACVDPVCNTGILVIEAASLACGRAPNLGRARWGFNGWAQMDEVVWKHLVQEAKEAFCQGRERMGLPSTLSATPSQHPGDSVCFVGASTSSPCTSRARAHARRAGLWDAVCFERADDQTICALVKRTAKAYKALCSVSRRTSDTTLPCNFLVACVLSEQDQVRFKAKEQAQSAAFSAAAFSAPASSRFAVCGGSDIEERFKVAPSACATFGMGRTELKVRVFDAPPLSPGWVCVPDSAGGASHKVQVLEPTSDQFAARLHKVAKERRRWARRTNISCYRLYDADLADYAFAIDLYTGAGEACGNTYIHIAEYAPPSSVDLQKARRRLNDALVLTPIVLGVRPDHVFVKTRRRDKGGSQYAETKTYPYVVTVQENGYLFELNLSSYLDTGLFLDHRLTRELIASFAQHTHFLNLFAYTGAASVYAAGAGALSTCSVDLSQTYLSWARRNMEQNGFTGAEHLFEHSDVMTWITQCRRTSRRFDLIFVDPPTFSNSKALNSRTWSVQRDHVELLIGVSRLLTEGGLAIFSCNLRSFKPDRKTLAKYGVELEDTTAQTIPHDFERNPHIHQCYILRRISAPNK